MQILKRSAALALGVSMLALIASAPARADQAEAQQIQAGIEAWLSENVDSAKTPIAIQGATAVAEDAAQPGLYRIDLPTFVFGKDKDAFTVAGLKATAKPTGNGLYDVTWSAPATLSFQDDKGRPMAITSAEQSNVGVWDAKLKTFRSLRSVVKGVALVDDKGQTLLKVGSVRLDVASTEPAKDRLDVVEGVAFDDLVVFDKDGKSQIVRVDRVKGDIDVKGFDVLGYVELAKKLQAVQAKVAAEAAKAEAARSNAKGKPGQGGAPTAERDAVADMVPIIQGFYTMLDGVSASFTVSGVRISPPPATMSDVQTVELRSLTLASRGADLRGAAMDGEVGIGFQGLTILPALPDAAFIPTDAAIQLGVNDVPHQAILEAFGKGLAAASAANPAAASAAINAAIMDAVMRTRSGIEVKRFEVAAPAYQVSLSGGVAADAKSPLLASGKLTMSVTGLEKIQERLAVDPQGKQAVGVAAMVTAMGQQQKDGSRRYELELTQDGKVLLNGADFGALMMGGGAAKPGPAPADKAPKKG